MLDEQAKQDLKELYESMSSSDRLTMWTVLECAGLETEFRAVLEADED